MPKDMMLNEVRTMPDGRKIKCVAATRACDGCIGCIELDDEEVGICDPSHRADAHDVIFVEQK